MSRSSLSSNVVDQNGVPVEGAQVYIYDLDGDLAHLSDALGQAADNPVISGQDGYWQAYVPEEGYYTAKYYWGGRLRRIDANLIAGRDPIRRAESYASSAEAFAGPTFPDIESGLAGTSSGQSFAVDDNGIVTVYLNDGGVAVPQRVIATTAALASPDPGKGADLVKLPTGRTVTNKLGELVSSADYPFTPAPLAEPPSEFVIHGNYGFGSDVIASNVGGFNNIAVGDEALASAEYVRSSIAIGNEALKNVVGDETGARGEEAPGVPGTYYSNGDNQIAIGDFALRDNTAGFENLAIGSYCLRDNKTGKWNLALGTMSQITGENTNGNISVGSYNLVTNTGNHNTTMGWAVMEGNQTGSGNVGIGWVAMSGNKTGSFNTAVGLRALASNDSGNYNTLLGYEAGQNLQTGVNNTAVGANSLNAAAGAATNNTAVGTNALIALTSGDANIALGSGAGNTTPSGTSNSISIGVGVSASKSNQIAIGSDVHTEAVIKGDVWLRKIINVADLPPPSAGLRGATAVVGDADISDWATAYNSIVSGGSDNVVTVMCTGSNWRIRG